MPYEYYYASGFCHTPTVEDPWKGVPEIILYNPTPEPCTATMKLYFPDRSPVTLDPCSVKPETNALVVFPNYNPALLTDCGYFGFKIESTTPLIPNYINIGPQLTHPAPQYSGGCCNFHATKLHTEWHFPDGLWLEWNKALNGQVEKAPFPFNEMEHYYFLNPNPADIELDMRLRFRDIDDMHFHFTVGAERLLVWENIDKVPYNKGYGVKVTSSGPMTCSSLRFIYGLRGFHEWGMNIHVTQWAVPGPIVE